MPQLSLNLSPGHEGGVSGDVDPLRLNGSEIMLVMSLETILQRLSRDPLCKLYLLRLGGNHMCQFACSLPIYTCCSGVWY